MIKKRIINFHIIIDALKTRAVLIIVGIITLIFASYTQNFYNIDNIFLILQRVSIIAITSVGLTMLIMIGEIDLSIGGVAAFSTVLGAVLMGNDINWIFSIILVALVGLAIGIINGLLISFFRIPSFLITLMVAQLLGALTYQMTGGLSSIGIYNAEFIFLGQGQLGFIPFSVILMTAIYIIVWFIMSKTAYGRYVRAIGGNVITAALACVPIKKVKISLFAISGTLTAVASMIIASKLRCGSTLIGVGWEASAIAAVIIGGTRFNSGEGNIVFSLIGALFLGIITSTTAAMGISTYTQTILQSLIIILVLILNAVMQFKKHRSLV